MRFVKYLIILFLLLCSTSAFSQRFVRDDAGQIWFIDSTSADTVKIDVTGAVFKIVNTGATFEMTSMTTTQRNALTASAGMIINNTTDGQIQGYDGTSWNNLGAGAGSGEENTASNLGGGLANFDSKSAVDLRFNSFLATDFNLAANQLSLDRGLAATWTAVHSFADNNFQINNPANTFQYIFGTAAIAADRTLELPLLTGNDIFTFNSFVNLWGDGIKQTFNPDATNAGLNVGSLAGQPSSPADGDLFYNTSANQIQARVNSAWVDLGAGSVTWDAIGDAAGAADILFADFGQTMTWNTPITATAIDAFTLRWTHDAISDVDIQRLLVLERQASGSGTLGLETLLRILNSDDQVVNTGIEIIGTSTGAITVGIDASDAEIVTAIDIGANDFLTAASTLSSVELDRLDGLANTIVTDNTAVTNVDGTNLSISAGTLNVDDAFLVNDAADEMLLADATTNVVTDILDLSHTGGTVAAGFGTGIRFDLEDAGGIEEQASIDVSLDVVTDGAEEASIIFRHNVAGTMQETMRIDGTSGSVGIGTSTPTHTLDIHGEVEIEHTATEDGDHALDMNIDAAGFGDIKGLQIQYDSGAISTGDIAAVIFVEINQIDAVGGDVIGIEILSTEGGADNIVGIKIGAEISPLIQDSGVFVNPSLGTNNTNTTNVPDMVDASTGTNTTIFVSDNDFIIIGASAAFTQIEFVIETGFGNPGIQPVFAFSTSGTNQFTNFTPTDGTDGFKNAGAFVVAWDADEVPSHVADDVTGTFNIRITRTANPSGSVSLFYARTAATRIFSIDESGNATFFTYIFEGATDDANEHTLNVIDPTADRLFNFPDDQLVAGDVLVASDASDLEYLNLANNELLFGDGAGIPTAAVLSGDVTNALGVITIAAGAVENSMHANMAQNTIKMRVASGTGDPEDIDISAGLSLVTGVSGDFVIIEDATDGGLKRVDVSDFLGGGVTWDAIGDAAGAAGINMAEQAQTLDWNTAATAAAFDGLDITLTNDATSDAARQVALKITRPSSSGTATVEALVEINNEDTDGAVTAAIEVVSAAGVITTALLVSDSDIVNWADIGANDLITSGGTITSVELDRLTGLAGIIVTDITSVTNVDGTNLSISAGTLNVDDAFLINDGDDTTTGTLTATGYIGNLYDASGAVDLDIGSADVTDVTVTTDGGDIVFDGNITQDAGTTLFMGGLLDATGAVDMDYGSADITDHTFISDGGTAIIDGSITAVGSFIIGSADMSETDLEKLDGITDGAGAANKALVLDASADIASGLANLTASATITVPTVLAGLLDPAGAVDLDLGSADILDVRIETDGGVVVIDGSITQDAGTTLFMGGLLDATGAVDMDYGSGDITDHTFSTDGTGTAEIVLPTGSIDGTEILDGTVSVEDVQPELDNRTISYSIIDTVKALDLFRIHEFNYAITIDSVVTNTDAGTHTFNIEHRAHTTPRSAGTDVLTADIVADAFESNSTFDDATIPANRPLYHVGSAVSGGADRCDVTIFYKID